MQHQRPFVAWDSQPLLEWSTAFACGQTIRVAGKTTHYVTKGRGPDVILVHGMFFDHTSWVRNVDVLARNFRVHAIDLWGSGYSTREPLKYSYQLFSHQLLSFMDQVKIETASLLGQSLGAGIAVDFSVRYPQRVNKLVLVAAAGLPNPEPLTAKLFMLPVVGETLLGLRGNRVRRRMLEQFFIANPGALSVEQFHNLIWSHKIAGTIHSMLAVMRGRFADKLAAGYRQLAQLPVPVLLIQGEADRALSRKTQQQLPEYLPVADHALIKHTGHLPNFESPAIFNSLVRDFLG